MNKPQLLYVRNAQGLFLAHGRKDRKHEIVRWVRTKEEAAACVFWVDADSLRVKLYTVNPRSHEPDIIDSFGVIMTPDRAKLQRCFSKNHTEMMNRQLEDQS